MTLLFVGYLGFKFHREDHMSKKENATIYGYLPSFPELQQISLPVALTNHSQNHINRYARIQIN